MTVRVKWHSATTYSFLVSSVSLSLKQLIHIFTSLVEPPIALSSLTNDFAFSTTDLWRSSVICSHFPASPDGTHASAPIQDFPLYSHSGFCFLLYFQDFSHSVILHLSSSLMIIPISEI